MKFFMLQLQNASDLLKLEKFEKVLKAAESDHRRLGNKRTKEVKKIKRMEEGLEWGEGRWKVPAEVSARAAEMFSDPNSVERVRARITGLEDKRKNFPAG